MSRLPTTYDTSGRMKTAGGVVTQFAWDAWDCVREVTGASETVYHIPDGTLQSFSINGTVYQCHMDALSSVRMITDATGAVVARFEYGAYGEEIFVSASSALANFPYRFVGALGCRTDAAVGMVYMRNRWFDPSLGQFISTDPIGLSGGANLYAYADNMPTNAIDPYGLDVLTASLWARLAVAAAEVLPAAAGAAAAAAAEVVPPFAAATGIAAGYYYAGQTYGPTAFEEPMDTMIRLNHVEPYQQSHGIGGVQSEANAPEPFPQPNHRAKAPVVGPPYPGPNKPSKLPGAFNKGGSSKQTCWLISWWSLDYCGGHMFCFYQCPDKTFKWAQTVSSSDRCPKKHTFNK